MIRTSVRTPRSQIQKRTYHKHIEHHKYASHMIDNIFRGAPSMGLLPEDAKDILNHYIRQDIFHQLAANTFAALEKGEDISPDKELISFIREVNKDESFTSPELYEKFNQWCEGKSNY
jgi:hypothetical protein